MIPITNMNGDPRDYKKGHSSKGKNNPMWKGGKMLDVEEYVLVKKPDHPFANNNGYVREHRLVMENKLGRYLTKEEVVHHINGVKNQNNIENLMLYSSHKIHIGNHRLGKHIDTSDRRCFRCGSKTTYIQKPTGSQKTPKLVWCHLPWDKENWYCQKCYYKSNSKYKIQNIIA
ncbi:MAG: HNH endonuclease [Candidatus Nitrosocosmicus sp.]|nr:HNH endonuclease [Candidatus Nitrosocosmicus sp.]